jgi:hypothetical protein
VRILSAQVSLRWTSLPQAGRGPTLGCRRSRAGRRRGRAGAHVARLRADWPDSALTRRSRREVGSRLPHGRPLLQRVLTNLAPTFPRDVALALLAGALFPMARAASSGRGRGEHWSDGRILWGGRRHRLRSWARRSASCCGGRRSPLGCRPHTSRARAHRLPDAPSLHATADLIDRGLLRRVAVGASAVAAVFRVSYLGVLELAGGDLGFQRATRGSSFTGFPPDIDPT